MDGGGDHAAGVVVRTNRGLAEQHHATGRLYTARLPVIGGTRGLGERVARDATDRCREGSVCIAARRRVADRRALARRVATGQMLRVDGVEQVDATVGGEGRIQRETGPAEFAIGADLRRQVDQRRRVRMAGIDQPDSSCALPDEQSAVGGEGEADRVVPGLAVRSGDHAVGEAGRQCRPGTRHRDEQQHGGGDHAQDRATDIEHGSTSAMAHRARRTGRDTQRAQHRQRPRRRGAANSPIGAISVPLAISDYGCGSCPGSVARRVGNL